MSEKLGDKGAADVSIRTVHGFVSGRVQGVYYRASFRDHGRTLQLGGWVKNLGDGRVEFVVQGSPQAIERQLRWARQGPPAARVESLEFADIEADELPLLEVSYY